jgi:hypothetical protein
MNHIYAYWTALPNPIKAAVVSSLFTLNTIFGITWATASADGQGGSFAAFWAYVGQHGFQIVMGYLYGTATASSFRAFQAQSGTIRTSQAQTKETPTT